MNKPLTPEEIGQLTVAERLKLIEALWDTLVETPDAVELPPWHREELDARLAAHHNDREAARPWSDVKANLIDARRK
jgi:putative addiction module component (TIGR02574 family)